jgi:predicted DNA-binding transcriptional regulator AlpA
METSRKSRFAMLDGSLLVRKGHARPAIPGDNRNAVSRAEVIAEVEAHHTANFQHNLAELIVRPMEPLNSASDADDDGAWDPAVADGDLDLAPNRAPSAVDAFDEREIAEPETGSRGHAPQRRKPRGDTTATMPLPPEARFGLMPRTWPGKAWQNEAVVAPRALDAAMAAKYVGVPRRTFARLVREGRLPGPLPFGGRKAWDRKVLDRALDELSGIEPRPAWHE